MGRFSQYQGEFQNQEAYNPNAAIPDGIYVVEVDKCYTDVTKSQKDVLKWHLKIVEGPHTGRLLFKNNFFHTPEVLGRLKGDWVTAGAPHLTPTMLDENPERALTCLIGVRLEVKVKQQKDNPDFQNVDFRKRVEGVGVGGMTGAAGAPRNGGASVLPQNAWNAPGDASFNPGAWGAPPAGTP